MMPARQRSGAVLVALVACVAFAPILAENVDPGTSDHVFEMLMGLVRSTGLSALIATHNLDLAARMDRTVRLEEGRIL